MDSGRGPAATRVPVPGVTFAVGTWTPEGGYQVLHNWIADERGLASGFVRVPVQEDARVWACPVSPGLQQRKAIARQVAEEWRVQPALVEGATARGHILGPNGLSCCISGASFLRPFINSRDGPTGSSCTSHRREFTSCALVQKM